ncbi:glycosyltransferase family 4 protein [Salinigranum rubrum]|uniref:Glycosyltransferase family 4 protein n=1 Tax=Salinigranum rubrum TaxID=755307 RepID=A0A2I8VL05_9EURY|nr:glycosyltransferase family 4 protein [Salinigranum rubrum]AUV82574.1 glycosyltransferase family 4 protein [Salinigranum rubrum]
MYSIVASAVNHPDSVNPYQGLFNQRILSSLAETDVSLDAVSPRPFAPPVGPYSEYSELPRVEEWGSYETHLPRFWYLLPKRLFYGHAGRSFAKRVPPYVERTFDVPDVVHACHIYLDGYGMLPYCREHDLPLFVVGHGAILNDFDDLASDVRKQVRETLDEATGVLCVSDALAEKARQHTDAAKVSTVPIGADPENFPTEEEATLRRELGIDPETTVVLFVGQFIERKGVGELVEVLPTLDLTNTEFVFVGSGGEMESDLRAAVSESRSPAGAVRTGISTAKLRQWYAVADLLVLPSHAEGRPTVIYEAMASETAVLATPVGGVSEQVVDGETGVLIPPGDVDALEAELTRLTEDRERLGEMGRRGHDRLRENEWTWDGHARRVRRLHEAALE